MPRLISLFTILLVIFGICGCSGTGQIVEPDSHSINIQEIDNLPVWVSDYDSNGNPQGGNGLLGLFSCSVDKLAMKAEIVPFRTLLLEDVLEVVDITNFLKLAPCTNCVAIKAVSLDLDGHLILNIGIRHPFPPGDPLKPITGRNRADLHVFNVEGIVISNAAITNFPSLSSSVANFRLINADGYTGYLDSKIDEIFPTPAKLHPFITHFADYGAGNYDPGNPMGFASVTDPMPSGNLVMPMGSDFDFHDYVFDFKENNIEFVFAVGCTYAVSAGSKNERFSPQYRVPQHNKKAASFVNVRIEENKLKSGDSSSYAKLAIRVLDINHGVPVGTALNEMRADSSVSKIEVEVPGVTSGAVSFSVIPTGGNGRDPMNPLTFNGTITNALAAPQGLYVGIVKVTDAYTPGLNTSPLLNSMDGIKRVEPIANPLTGLFPISEFATYQIFEIPILVLNEPPVAILKPNPALGCDGSRIWFNGASSYDTDGTVEIYEFDFDLPGGNPANFSPDVSGTSSRVQSSVYSAGNYVAALRVFDNDGASSITTVPVTITQIDGFNVSPYSKVYVTDTSFSNVIFTPNGFNPTDSQNQQLGLEAMARGDSFIYAVFHATGTCGTGLYIARSSDNGSTWDYYNFVRATTSGAIFRGVAIDAVGSEVFVAIGESNPKSLFLAYNANNCEGSFAITQISDSQGFCSISIAVDPFDTKNIYIGSGEESFWHHFEAFWLYVSNAGPNGPFTSTRYPTWNGRQAYTGEFKVAPDRDVYYLVNGNYDIEVYRSQNYGVNFTPIYQAWDYAPWGREGDYCFNPNNPEMIHWVITYRVLNVGWRHTYRRSTNGGVSWTIISTNLHGTDTGYTNAAVTTDSKGNLYIVYTDSSSGNAEVYGRYSTDNGNTFTPYFPISSHPLNDGHVEIIPTIDGCDVIVCWLEDRDNARRVVCRRG